MEKIGLHYLVLGFKRIIDFNGVSNRAEYFYFSFWSNVIAGLLAFSFGYESIIYLIFLFSIIVPSVSLAIRRLHDVDKSGWNLLWSLTIIGIFYVVYLTFKQSSNSKNDIGLGLSIMLFVLASLLSLISSDDNLSEIDSYSYSPPSNSSPSNYSSCSDYDLVSVDWVYPDYNNAQAAWKFNSGGTFNYSSIYFNTTRYGSWTRNGCNVTLYYSDTGESKTINISSNRFTIGSTTYKAY